MGVTNDSDAASVMAMMNGLGFVVPLPGHGDGDRQQQGRHRIVRDRLGEHGRHQVDDDQQQPADACRARPVPCRRWPSPRHCAPGPVPSPTRPRWSAISCRSNELPDVGHGHAPRHHHQRHHGDAAQIVVQAGVPRDQVEQTEQHDQQQASTAASFILWCSRGVDPSTSLTR